MLKLKELLISRSRMTRSFSIVREMFLNEKSGRASALAGLECAGISTADAIMIVST